MPNSSCQIEIKIQDIFIIFILCFYRILNCFGNFVADTLDFVRNHLCIFAEKYLRRCEDTYFITLQNKYLCIYKDSFGAKILRDDSAIV